MKFSIRCFLVACIIFFPTSIALSANSSCKPPAPVRELLKVGTAVIVCADGIITVDKKLVDRAGLFAVLEDKLVQYPNKPIRIAIEISEDKEFRERLMEFSLEAPEGSGVIMFGGDMWFGGLNSSVD